ncbi:hypothetical protein C8R44DRAFT_896190 [Mycena epipterygia]|nr:hypothetical protein C8R44DRAFT_896190 [Mycena epipterygia]
MHIYVAALLFTSSIRVSAQTLYQVTPSPISGQPIIVDFVSTSIISGGGVGADGETTYVEAVVESTIREETTLDVFSTSSTTTLILVEGASGYAWSAAFLGGEIQVKSSKHALSGTFTGSVTPVFTLPPPAPTSKINSATSIGAAVLSGLMCWGVVSSVIGTLLHVL